MGRPVSSLFQFFPRGVAFMLLLYSVFFICQPLKRNIGIFGECIFVSGLLDRLDLPLRIGHHATVRIVNPTTDSSSLDQIDFTIGSEFLSPCGVDVDDSTETIFIDFHDSTNAQHVWGACMKEADSDLLTDFYH